MKTLIVKKEDDGKKLLTYISEELELNYNALNKILRNKDIKINGVRTKENSIIKKDDKIEIYYYDKPISANEIETIYEDDNLLICQKPINIETQGNGSLHELLKVKYEYIEPCHRLDRNTDGIIIFAKNEKALNNMLRLFKEHNIEKHYIACVYGIPKMKSMKIENYLFKDSKKSLVYVSDVPKKNYLKAITEYKVIKENKEKNISLLNIKLVTGKTHQIRTVLSHIHYPVIGDRKIWRL